MQNELIISVNLLSEVSVRLPDRVVRSFRSNRAAALLGYLATHPGRQSREHLAAMLWPDSDSVSSLHNLRQALQYLRHALGNSFEQMIEVTRRHVAARTDSFQCDASLLLTCDHPMGGDRRRLCEEAVRLYAGSFLPGLDDAWICEMRLRLSQAYVRALLFLADLAIQDRPQQALGYAEMAVAEEPLMDGPRARKIRALVRMGERAAALQEFEAFADLLNDELGIAPSDGVRQALDDAPVRVTAAKGIPDQIGVASDVSFALSSLANGDRPQLAVELAIALTPHWIAIGTPRLGIEAMTVCRIAAAGRMTEELSAKSELCVVELTFAHGDIRRAVDLLQAPEIDRHRLPKALQARAFLLESRGYLTQMNGRAAIERAEGALNLIKSEDEDGLELDLQLVLGSGLLLVHDLSAALKATDRATALAEKGRERVASGIALVRRAQILLAMGRVAEAEADAVQSLKVTESISTGRARAHRLQVARLMEDLESLDAAEAGYRAVLSETQRVEAAFEEVLVLTYLGDLVHARGHPREAISLHTRALEIRRDLSQTLGVATSLRGLGRALLDVGDLTQAREALIESAELFRSQDATPGYASVLLTLAMVETRADNVPLGIRLARRALRLFQGMTPFERLSNGRSGATAIEDAVALIERH